MTQTPSERMKILSTRVKEDLELGPNTTIVKYFMFARSLHVNFQNYLNSNKKEEAYILALRLLLLMADYLPKHPSYSTVPAERRQEWRILLKKVASSAEILKREIYCIYEKEYQNEMNPSPNNNDQKVLSTQLSSNTTKYLNQNEFGPICPSMSLKVNQFGLITLKVPAKLGIEFEKLSSDNTKHNIETCGTLCGRFFDNEYRVTNLLLPKQKGSPDSCCTLQEEDILAYLDSTESIVLGWIHTHPSQTAFLSSVDLHTQLSYQLMLPEAIAIVVAPKHNEIGYFSLTPDYGLEFLKQCKNTGFHPHSSTRDLFQKSPHVICNEDFVFEIKDLR